MRWLHRKTDRVPASTAGLREADKALGKAEARLEQVQGETPVIMEAAHRLKRLGERNDFAQRIREALGGAR